MTLSRRTALAAAALLPTSLPSCLRAQTRDLPVQILCTTPPGGSTDKLARVMAPLAGTKLGRPVIVENRAGADGIIALRSMLGSPRDGSVVTIITNTQSLIGLMHDKLPFDPARDFRAVSWVASTPNVLVVPSDSPFMSVADVIAAAKAKPGSLSYGRGGLLSYLAAEQFKYTAKVDIAHVPYKGNGPLTADLLGGHVPMGFLNVPEVLPLATAGKLRPLAVGSRHRAPTLPDVPTLIEAGVPDFENVVWYGLIAAADVPDEAVARLSEAFSAAINVPSIASRLKRDGWELAGSSPETFAGMMSSERSRWAALAKNANLRLE